jgi:two-component system sensor histidine kinase BaeS
MKVHHKLFITLTIFIIVMSSIFTWLTYLVVREAIQEVARDARGEEMDALSETILQHYQDHGQSWTGIEELDLLAQIDTGQSTSILITSAQDQVLLHAGDEIELLIRRLGLHQTLTWNREPIGHLYYYDPEVSYMSKLRIGIPLSVLTLLVMGTIIFIAASLMIAYAISKRLTAPLQQLIPIIERMGHGELGLQAPAHQKDEYGQVARAFNRMSQMLQRSETTRRNLVADVAHELRTPLTIIRGKLELAQHDGRPIDPVQLLPVQDELIRLTKLVEDLNLISLAEADRLPLEKQATDITALITTITERLRDDAERKEITLSIDNQPDLPLIHVDPYRISQVLLNLAANAIRYTPDHGTVTIKAETIQAGNAAPEIQITVSDTGPGIAAEHLPHLFDRFYRTDEGRSRNSGGIGLGLAIARGIVLAHQGTISVESELGLGTSFIVRLPVNSSSQGVSS